MSFFDRARAGYEQLAGQADQALDSATAGRELGEVDRNYRDLGLLAYLEATGRRADAGAREEIIGVLRAMEERGAIRDFTLATRQGAPAGTESPQQPPGGSDGVPTPPPERAGRHGDFLGQPRQAPPPPPPAGRSGPDESTGPRPSPPPPPSVGGTWGPTG